MANEKNKDLELNTPDETNEEKAEPITADDLIKRLKSNLKNNPNLKDETLFEQEETSDETVEEVVEEVADPDVPEEEEIVIEEYVIEDDQTAEKQLSFEDVSAEETVSENVNVDAFSEEDFFKSLEESYQKAMNEEVPALEEVAEPVEEPKVEKKMSVTDSIKSLIASLKRGNKTEVAEEIVPEEIVDDEPAEEYEELTELDQLPEEDAVPVEPEKEYSVVIENTSDKTNVFDPSLIKNVKKSADTDSLFEENEAPAVVEAEQLTFNMTEDDLQKSIKEAEDFIFEREYIGNPEEIINNIENVEAENILGDPNAKTEEYDQTDLWIASAFGDEDEVKNMYGDEAAQEIQTQLDIDVQSYLDYEKPAVTNVKIEEEYESQAQKKDVFAKYRKQHKIGLAKIAICMVICFVAFLYENLPAFGAGLPGALNPQNYPTVFILISLQLLVLAAAVAWEELYRGVRALIAMRPLPESLTAATVALSAIYHVVHCFISETDPSVTLYVFPVITLILVTLFYDFFNLKREIYSFNIIASKRLKYTINTIENDGAKLENEAFGDYLSNEDEISMFKIGKTGFVKGFRERMSVYSRSYSLVSLLLSVAVALGLIFFIISTVFYDVKKGFSLGYLAFMFALPACSMLSFAYPFYKASKKAFDDDSAIIGYGSLEEYSKANTLSFDDKDVFPSYGVKVKSIKVYGDSRIDKVLYNAASVFKTIGGPLADVFDTATRELGNSDNMEIIEIAKDGIESIIDGQHVYVGKANYLRTRNIAPIVEPGDDDLETRGEASVMYMVCDDEIAAKIYVQYTIDPDFEFTLRKLYRAGICIGIKTFDPNIDDKLLGSKVKITKYPVRILRCSSLEEKTAPLDEANSGIVSKGGPRSLLNTFVLCSKVLNASRMNVTVKGLSVLLSILIMAFLLMFGGVASIPSLWVVLYQAFWMVPIYLISKFFL